ncbi:MAG: hypothetical protein WKG32_08345 [Gemmatimonadaceae bacterium]
MRPLHGRPLMGRLAATLAVTSPVGPQAGTVYLLHFDRPLAHAKHYTGWTRDLDARLAQHRAGRGARLVEVVTEAGITFTIARTWKGTRKLERMLKRHGGQSRNCPLCSGDAALRRGTCRRFGRATSYAAALAGRISS